MTRIAHLADLHLGARLDGVPVASAVAGIAATAVETTFSRTVDAVRTGGFDGVIVAGDVFDRSPDAARFVPVFAEALAAWHEDGLPTIVISGNHDAESALRDEVVLPPTVRWLRADAPETVIWDDLGIAVHGQSIIEADDLRDLAAGYPAALAGLRNIGVLHTSLTGERSRRACAPTTLAQLDAHGYDYWALGHVHERRVLDAAGRIAYAGSLYGRRPAEPGPHGFLDVALTASGTAASPVDTAVVEYATVAVGDPADFAARLADRRARLADRAVIWTLAGEITAEVGAIAAEIVGRAPAHALGPAQPTQAQ